MWTCPVCGCQGIAAGLDFCPKCRVRRNADVGEPPVIEGEPEQEPEGEPEEED